MLSRLLVGSVLLAFATPLIAADLTLRFVYDGPVPETKWIEFPSGKKVPDESLLVNSEDHGIAGVVVYVRLPRGTALPSSGPSPTRKWSATIRDGQFSPRTLLLRPGDTLHIKNRDEFGYVINTNFLNNTGLNIALQPNKEFEHVVKKPEPGPVLIQCGIHPWTTATMLCLDHPHAGVTDRQGRLTLRGLPEEMDLTFIVRHESLGSRLESLELSDANPNRFTISLSPGAHVQKTVLVKPKS